MQVIQLLVAGGVVMIPLLVLSIVAIALIAERLRFWFRVTRRQRRVVRVALGLYKEAGLDETLICLKRNLDLPIVRIFIAALSLDRPNPEEFRLALETEAQAEIPILKRFTTAFDTIVMVSPLLGLLGTVTGLIRSFASLNLGNIGGTQTLQVTGGISEALVSTATGLIVAIVTLMFANTFRGIYQRQTALIQEYGGQLELLYRQQYERQEDGYALTR
ncbi:MotA/TolQ/ExbB proton channel family protein [Lyngbya confervoides]|uniref:MotA/TolQ/ExbB proton channel family protein n=1 Tax=Lyngbya confervoides BDU141951 TaxID=1574623 RepID=A0ABD4T2C4_9CYAN|nr:MotA/TolQ/ExbB proton channel family protein [Lyngbya confervoides]MCM1982911.1 MotA/TolQ/ExbB proton channel family protein [Lyngbya confervoides BDU141951]